MNRQGWVVRIAVILSLAMMAGACSDQRTSDETSAEVQGIAESSGDGFAQAPFAVGSVTRFIHDPTRGYDTVAGVDGGMRTLIAEVWYPVDREILAADPDRYRRALYTFRKRTSPYPPMLAFDAA